MTSTGRTKAKDKAARTALVICAIILVAISLYLARTVFAPLAFALFILAIVWPLQEALEKRLPRGLALLATLVITAIVVLIFGSLIAWALSAIGE